MNTFHWLLSQRFQHIPTQGLLWPLLAHRSLQLCWSVSISSPCRKVFSSPSEQPSKHLSFICNNVVLFLKFVTWKTGICKSIVKLAPFHTQPKPHSRLQQRPSFFLLLLLCRKYRVIPHWEEMKVEHGCLCQELSPAHHQHDMGSCTALPPWSSSLKGRAVRFLKASWR